MDTTQSLSTAKRSSLMQIAPVMLCFFAMGFVDLVGTASNYVQKDLGLTDSQANLFLSLVFFWFLIFSVPTGMLMNRIGRKKTVLISLAVTASLAHIAAYRRRLHDNARRFFTARNRQCHYADIAEPARNQPHQQRQTGFNPYIRTICKGHRLVSLQYLPPGATTYLPTFGLGWRALFAIYAE